MTCLRRALLVAILLGVLLGAPTVAAAGFSFLAPRQLESSPDEQGEARYEMPIRVEEDGHLYAKLLPTDANAVHDGRAANGSVADERGWRASFAVRLADGTVEDLGTFVDSTPTRLVRAQPGDEVALLVTLHVPTDAAAFGAEQRVYVAVAFRLASAGEESSGSSGGQMDQARAMTLIVRLDPALATPTPAPTSAPAQGGDDEPAAPTAHTPGTLGPEEDEGPMESTDPGPVGPVQNAGAVRVIVEQAPLPTWFLVAILALGAGVLVALLALLRTLQLLARLRAEEAPPRAGLKDPRRRAVEER